MPVILSLRATRPDPCTEDVRSAEPTGYPANLPRVIAGARFERRTFRKAFAGFGLASQEKTCLGQRIIGAGSSPTSKHISWTRPPFQLRRGSLGKE
jgi:hypothetical protein